MSTLLKINVTNKGANAQDFFFFQQPAIYSGGPKVYSNSLFSEGLGNNSSTAAKLTFEVNMQYYAGIQQVYSEPAVGQSTGFASAIRPVDLASTSGSGNCMVEASVDPLGLTQAAPDETTQPGAFRVKTPIYDAPAAYNVGSALEVNGGIVMSNFVRANPNNYTDCEPILKFYVRTGVYTTGTVMDFTQSSVDAALCDFTGGHSIINATLESNGTWTTEIVG